MKKNFNQMDMIKKHIALIITVCGLLGLCSCEINHDSWSQFEAGEIKTEGIVLNVDKKDKDSLYLYGEISASGATFKLIPDGWGYSLCCFGDDIDFHYARCYPELFGWEVNWPFEPPITDFTPNLSMGGEWFGACEWMWIECVPIDTLGNKRMFEYMVYVDRNSTGEPRAFALEFSEAYKCRTIHVTQEGQQE